jgi:hypothetical protein
MGEKLLNQFGKPVSFNYSKPKLDPNLKIRSITGPEEVLSEYRKRYTTREGKTTWKGSMRLLGDVGKKIIRRIIGLEE